MDASGKKEQTSKQTPEKTLVAGWRNQVIRGKETSVIQKGDNPELVPR